MPLLSCAGAFGLFVLEIGWLPVPLAIASLVVMPAAFFFGQALALLLVVRRWLRSVEGTAQILPAFLGRVRNDVHSFTQGGEISAVDAADASVRAYDAVLLPLAKESLAENYGMAGGAVAFVYERTASRVLRTMIGNAVTSAAKADRQASALAILGAGERIGTWLHKNLRRYVGPVRAVTWVLSLFVMFATGFFAFLLPLLISSFVLG